MAILTLRRKLAANSKKKNTWNYQGRQSRNTLDPEMAQEYISHVSEEIEERVTRKLSKEISRTESRILGAVSKLASETTGLDLFRSRSRNIQEQLLRKPGTHWGSSLNDPCPELVCSSHHSGNSNGSEVDEYPHMVTGGPDEIRNRTQMVTGIQEEIPYCYPGTSSGKQKKARSTSQSHFRSENTSATVEADQILLDLPTIGDEH